MITLCWLVAMSTTSLGVLMEVVGATAATTSSFSLPALFYVRLGSIAWADRPARHLSRARHAIGPRDAGVRVGAARVLRPRVCLVHRLPLLVDAWTPVSTCRKPERASSLERRRSRRASTLRDLLGRRARGFEASAALSPRNPLRRRDTAPSQSTHRSRTPEAYSCQATTSAWAERSLRRLRATLGLGLGCLAADDAVRCRSLL